ncbi:tRNA nucleotidyltransferase [Desulfosporosinus sp. I2]|uniref:HD domain-containing protein n=1 Tax=Desulfosporosinus sp. I2 TaxID=1617025 RepID=UPI0005F00803|nr:HD domain-containing protein [Desulfosporosinus sp. I2]KJR46862.1 tRNA nucleotidyltransferase [Desulfosporosinus sp. I2]
MIGTSFQQGILRKLSEYGPVYIVGGAVRDALLGIPSKDLDLVSVLSLQEIYTLLSDGGYNPHVMGAKQQTLSLFQGTDRMDIVSFDGEIKRDALHRDFTLNALYQDVRTGEIKDPLKGLEDLKIRRLRACGSADERFNEDPLRTLRLVRLAIRHNFTIEPETWQAALDHVPDLKNVSFERVTVELGRILLLDEVDKALGLLNDLGYFQAYIPELARLKGLIQNQSFTMDAWEHTCQVVKNTPMNVLVRLAALFHDLGTWKTAEGKRHFLEHEKESVRLVQEILPRFRWSMVLQGGSRGERELMFLVGHHSLGALTFKSDLKQDLINSKVHKKAQRLAWQIGWDGQKFDTQRVENLLDLWRADFLAGNQNTGEYRERINRIQDEIRTINLVLIERTNSLDWRVFEKFAHAKGLEGKQFGRLKEQIRSRAMMDTDICFDLNFLEKEYQLFWHNSDS